MTNSKTLLPRVSAALMVIVLALTTTISAFAVSYPTMVGEDGQVYELQVGSMLRGTSKPSSSSNWDLGGTPASTANQKGKYNGYWTGLHGSIYTNYNFKPSGSSTTSASISVSYNVTRSSPGGVAGFAMYLYEKGVSAAVQSVDLGSVGTGLTDSHTFSNLNASKYYYIKSLLT